MGLITNTTNTAFSIALMAEAVLGTSPLMSLKGYARDLALWITTLRELEIWEVALQKETSSCMLSL